MDALVGDAAVANPPGISWSVPPQSIYPIVGGNSPVTLPLPARIGPGSPGIAAALGAISQSIRSRELAPLAGLPSLLGLVEATTTATPVTVPSWFFRSTLRPVFLIQVAIGYVLLTSVAWKVIAIRAEKRRSDLDRSVLAQPPSWPRLRWAGRAAMSTVALVHSAVLVLFSGLAIVAVMRTLGRVLTSAVQDDNTPAGQAVGVVEALLALLFRDGARPEVPVVDALCKAHGPAGLGSAPVWNASSGTWTSFDPTVFLFNGRPNRTDGGRLWNEGLAFWSWAHYLAQVLMLADPLYGMLKGKSIGYQHITHQLLELAIRWANVRYMNPASWISILAQSLVSFLTYSTRMAAMAGLVVPQRNEQILLIGSLPMILQAASSAVYLAIGYGFPVKTTTTVAVETVQTVTVPVPVSVPTTTSPAPVLADAAAPGESTALSAGSPVGPAIKKLLLYAVGEVGMAENIGHPAVVSEAPAAAPEPPRQLPVLPQERIEVRHVIENKLIDVTRYEQTRCIDTTGQVFANSLGLVYLGLLLVLLVQMVVSSVTQSRRPGRVEESKPKPKKGIKTPTKESRTPRRSLAGPVKPAASPAGPASPRPLSDKENAAPGRPSAVVEKTDDLESSLPNPAPSSDDHLAGTEPESKQSQTKEAASVSCLPTLRRDNGPGSPDDDVFPVASHDSNVDAERVQGAVDVDTFAPSSPFVEHPAESRVDAARLLTDFSRSVRPGSSAGDDERPSSKAGSVDSTGERTKKGSLRRRPNGVNGTPSSFLPKKVAPTPSRTGTGSESSDQPQGTPSRIPRPFTRSSIPKPVLSGLPVPSGSTVSSPSKPLATVKQSVVSSQFNAPAGRKSTSTSPTRKKSVSSLSPVRRSVPTPLPGSGVSAPPVPTIPPPTKSPISKPRLLTETVIPHSTSPTPHRCDKQASPTRMSVRASRPSVAASPSPRKMKSVPTLSRSASPVKSSSTGKRPTSPRTLSPAKSTSALRQPAVVPGPETMPDCVLADISGATGSGRLNVPNFSLSPTKIEAVTMSTNVVSPDVATSNERMVESEPTTESERLARSSSFYGSAGSLLVALNNPTSSSDFVAQLRAASARSNLSAGSGDDSASGASDAALSFDRPDPTRPTPLLSHSRSMGAIRTSSMLMNTDEPLPSWPTDQPRPSHATPLWHPVEPRQSDSSEPGLAFRSMRGYRSRFGTTGRRSNSQIVSHVSPFGGAGGFVSSDLNKVGSGTESGLASMFERDENSIGSAIGVAREYQRPDWLSGLDG